MELNHSILFSTPNLPLRYQGELSTLLSRSVVRRTGGEGDKDLSPLQKYGALAELLGSHDQSTEAG